MDEIKEFCTRKSVRQKIHGYLFNPNNYEGWMKGQWFIRALGFNPKEPKHLQMLEEQIKYNPDEAHFTEDTEWGYRYKQKVTIIGPSGKIIKGIRLHWQKDKFSGIITLNTLLPPKKYR
jgi:hypothetical protein